MLGKLSSQYALQIAHKETGFTNYDPDSCVHNNICEERNYLSIAACYPVFSAPKLSDL